MVNFLQNKLIYTDYKHVLIVVTRNYLDI